MVGTRLQETRVPEPAPIISDNRGDPYQAFFWLPPIMPVPHVTGTFDPKANVTIIINGPGTSLAEVAKFTVGGPPGARVAVEHASETYVATWRTSQCARAACRLEPNRVYTIWAFVTPDGSTTLHRLAIAQVWVVSRQEDLASVDPTQYIGLVKGSTLPIRFRVLSGLMTSVRVTPNPVTIAVGEQVQLTATSTDIHGTTSNAPVQWYAPDNIATVSASGLVTGVSPGITAVTAFNSSQGSTLVTVTSVAETPPVLVHPATGTRVLQNNPATSCPVDPIAGHGYRVTLRWVGGSGPKGILGHQLLVEHPPTGRVLLDTVRAGTATLAGLNGCGMRVPNDELDGYQWKARVKYVDGTYGPWSAPQGFGFFTVDQSPDFTLNPPDYGTGKTQVSVSGTVDATTSATVRLQTRMATSSVVFTPPAVEFYRQDLLGFFAELYVPMGPWTSFTILDQGFRRFWNQWMVWDPAPAIQTGPVGVIATVVDPFGNRFTSNREAVMTVP